MQMSAVCQRRKKSACAFSGTSWTEAEKGELRGDARVRVEAGDLFVGVFWRVDPRDGGTGRQKNVGATGAGPEVKDSEEESGLRRG